MNTSAKVATALAAGYVLGRTKKMRLAITVGGLLAGKRIATDPRTLARLVMQSPQMERLTAEARDRLVEAGRDAAVAVASNRINKVSDSIRTRTDRMRSPGRAAEDVGADEDVESAEQESGDGRTEERHNGKVSDEGRSERTSSSAKRPSSSGGRPTEERRPIKKAAKKTTGRPDRARTRSTGER